MSRSSLASVVFPLEEHPLMATMMAFRSSIVAAALRLHVRWGFNGPGRARMAGGQKKIYRMRWATDAE